MRVMKKRIGQVILVAVLILAAGCVWGDLTEIPRTVVSFVEEELVEYGRNPSIVKAVEAQNAKGASLRSIQSLDQRWTNTEGVDRFMFDLMRNSCSYHLINFQNSHSYIVETFVMDNKGALVGLTNKTSDYWQGDEAKFTESFKNGTGAVHYGDIEYDDSVGEILVQVSVPVMRGPRAVGAITFGISLDRWERR